MTLVVGTAGHIDHGKTTLLRALTGIDADRLPEERARGMTIDVGYAHLRLTEGEEVDFVDVPGHDRLVGTMLVGAGEIDAVMLVVAADDGPRAQTLEHLELLDGLGISIGLAVVTKIDTVSAERVATVVDEVRALLGRTTLAGCAVVAVSSVSGDGMDDLRHAVAGLSARRGPPTDPALATGRIRFAIDRVFSIRGRGTVVTGTLRGGPIQRGSLLRVVPGLADRQVRVREVQVHGQTVELAGPGRVALNVASLDAIAELKRGTVLTTDPAVVTTDRILVALRPALDLRGSPGGSPALPADRTAISLHLGTGHAVGTLGRSKRDAHDLSGGEGSAIVRLDRAIAAAVGDRFVLRRPSPVGTLAAGQLLDPRPPRGIARRRATTERLTALARAEPGGEGWRAARLGLHGMVAHDNGADRAVQLADDVSQAVDGALAEGVAARGELRTAEAIRIGSAVLRRLVGGSWPGGADRGVVDRAVAARLDRLTTAGRLGRDGDVVHAPNATAEPPSASLLAAMDRLVAALAHAIPAPLSEALRTSGCSPDGLRALEQSNRIVRLDTDLAWAAATYDDLARLALTLATVEPLTPAAYRDATGTSRKYALAILEDLDRRAILRRTSAGHVPGPRAGMALTPAPRPEPPP